MFNHFEILKEGDEQFSFLMDKHIIQFLTSKDDILKILLYFKKKIYRNRHK